MSGLDIEIIRHALETARSNGFVQVKLNHGDDAFRAILDPNLSVNEEADSEEDDAFGSFAAAEVSDTFEVKSPCVGYFQAGKTEAVVGAKVEEGEVIGVIQALGIGNDVSCKSTGTIEEVFVKPGQAVEFGQPIARLKR